MTIPSNSQFGAEQLHIVQGVLSLDLGGLERLVLDLVRVFCAQGHRVSVVCIERPGRLADEVARAGAEIHSLDKSAGRSVAAVQQATELLRKLRPDVLHTHQIGALWYLGQAAEKIGLGAVVHTEHSDHVMHSRGWWNKLKVRWRWRSASRYARRFCCVSEDIAKSARRWGTVPASKVQTVLNGIDTTIGNDLSHRDATRETLGFATADCVIGTVGRLTEVKRQDLLLRAFAQLALQFDNARLLMVGDGPERTRLEGLAAELGIREKAVFAGYQSRPECFLQAMDIFALTSRHEGLPLSLLEAWAVGLPVVSSAVGGIPRVVEHGKTGLLFPAGDELTLVHSLEQVISSPELSKRLTLAGRRIVQTSYSLDRMAMDYKQIYAALNGVAACP